MFIHAKIKVPGEKGKPSPVQTALLKMELFAFATANPQASKTALATHFQITKRTAQNYLGYSPNYVRGRSEEEKRKRDEAYMLIYRRSEHAKAKVRARYAADPERHRAICRKASKKNMGKRQLTKLLGQEPDPKLVEVKQLLIEIGRELKNENRD